MSYQRVPAVKISRSSIRADHPAAAHTADPLLIHILELAQHLLDIPIAVAGFTAMGKQILHASVGLDAYDGADDLVTVAANVQKDDLLVIPDTSVDPGLGGDILATQAPGIRFYAGARLRTPDSTTRVTLCLLDTEPRTDFSEAGRRTRHHEHTLDGRPLLRPGGFIDRSAWRWLRGFSHQRVLSDRLRAGARTAAAQPYNARYPPHADDLEWLLLGKPQRQFGQLGWVDRSPSAF